MRWASVSMSAMCEGRDRGVSLSSLTQHLCGIIPVISLQFPHRRAKWDLPGSLSVCLKHKNIENVCLHYIVPQLVNGFCWQNNETLILKMLCFLGSVHLFLFFFGSYWEILILIAVLVNFVCPKVEIRTDGTLDCYIFHSWRKQTVE